MDVSQGMTQDMQHRFDEGERSLLDSLCRTSVNKINHSERGIILVDLAMLSRKRMRKVMMPIGQVQTNNARRPTNTERRLDLVA